MNTSSATVAIAFSTPPIASYASLVSTAPRRCFHNCSSKNESKRQASRFLAHVPEDSRGQTGLEFKPHFARGRLDDLAELPLVHRGQRDLGALADAFDQGAVSQDMAVEIGPAREDHAQEFGLRRVEQLVRERSDELVIAAERVQLLPLVDDQQQPLRPRLLVQGDLDEVAEGQRPFLETGGLLVGLFPAVHLVVEVRATRGRRARFTRLFRGRAVGTIVTTSQPLSRSALSFGTRPARTTDDLPLPEAPTTATNGWRMTAAASRLVSSSRPKKRGASSSR